MGRMKRDAQSAIEEALKPFGAIVVNWGAAAVLVKYQGADTAQGIIRMMNARGFELTHDHVDLRHLDFLSPDGHASMIKALKPSMRARASLTLFFCFVTLGILEFQGKVVSRLLVRLFGG